MYMEEYYLKEILRTLKKRILKEKAFKDFFNFEDKINLIKLNNIYSKCLYNNSKDILDEKKVLEKELSVLNNEEISLYFQRYNWGHSCGIDKNLKIILSNHKGYLGSLEISENSLRRDEIEVYDNKEKKYYIDWNDTYKTKIKDIDEDIHKKIVNLVVKVKLFLNDVEEFTHYYVTKHIDNDIDYIIKIEFIPDIPKGENTRFESVDKYMLKISFFNIRRCDVFTDKENLCRSKEHSFILRFDKEKKYLKGDYFYSVGTRPFDDHIEIKNINTLYSMLYLIKIPIKKLPSIFLNLLEAGLTEETIDLERQTIEKEIEENIKKIEELISKNQELNLKLQRRLPILSTQLFKEVEKYGEKYYIINCEYKYVLQNYDLSKISFDNVDIRGIDFRGTNVNSNLFDLQKIHNKDASNCNFSTTEDNAKDFIFDYATDFTGVNLSGTNMNSPCPILLNSTINKAYIDESTILPIFYQTKVKKKSLW